MEPRSKKRLGELLVEASYLDRLQLRAALLQQEQWGKPLGRTLVEMRLLSEPQLIRILSEQLHLPTVDLSTTPVSHEALAFLGEYLCRKLEVLPFAYDTKNRFLDIAMSDIQSQFLYDTLRVRTRCNIRPFLAGPDAIRDAIERAFGPDLSELELNFRLDETLFDFGVAEPEDLRHLDPAVWPEKPPETPARPTALPFDPAVARSPGPPQEPREPPTAVSSRSAPQGREDRGPFATQGLPVKRPRSSAPLPPPPPGMPLPPGVYAVPAPVPDAIEDLLASALARLDRQEALVQRLGAEVRELSAFVGQLARRGLIELPPEHRPRRRSAVPISAPPEPALEIEEEAAAQGPTFELVLGDDDEAAPAPAAPAPAPAPALELVVDGASEEPAAGARLVTAPRRPAAVEVRPAAARAAAGTEPLLPLLELPAGARTVVAMDLGTTRSSVATVVDGRASVLRLPGGEWDIPSVVGFREDGSVVLGEAARQMLSSDPENVIASPKRLLGRRFDEPALGPYLAQLGMKATPGPQHEIILHSRGRKLSITAACAHILHLLRLVAERSLGRPVHDVILNVPATAGERQLRALFAAAAKVELHVLEFLHEPVAAAMACIFDEACEGRVAVYDFGGGTFDFSIVELGGESMQVVASSGDSWLGGDDFDIALAAAAANACWQQHRVELRNQAHHWQRLLVAAEATKRTLSQHEEAVLRLPGALGVGDSEAAFEFPITRKKFAELTRGIALRSLESCEEALAAAKLRPRELHAVYLSGGTSHIPSVQEAVASFFGKAPRVVISPERMVVVGAAVHGALMPQG